MAARLLSSLASDQLEGRRVLVRADLNVPLRDGTVADDTRIRASIPTLDLLTGAGASVILLSHLGRPGGAVDPDFSLAPVADRLEELAQGRVAFVPATVGPEVQERVASLEPGEILLLENTRFLPGETANDPELAAAWAGLGQVFVNDAFGTAHRAHASTVGVAEILPAYAGLLMEREIRNLSALLENPRKPFAAIIGGAKVSDKIQVLDTLLEHVDKLLIGGGMANTFLVAQDYTVGKSLLEKDRVEDAKRIMKTAEKKGVGLVLPTDVLVAKEVTRGAEHKIVPVKKIPNSWSAVDIGPESREAFEAALADAMTVVWNGPMGVFEVPTFGDGTRGMARMLADRVDAGASVVVGGGDSVAAIEELGLTSRFTHISTGGGASLEFLEGKELPGIKVLQDRSEAIA